MHFLGLKLRTTGRDQVAPAPDIQKRSYLDILLSYWHRSKPVLLLTTLLCSPITAQANIFDPLLRILIPSYNSNETPNTQDAANQDQASNSQDQINSPTKEANSDSGATVITIPSTPTSTNAEAPNSEATNTEASNTEAPNTEATNTKSSTTTLGNDPLISAPTFPAAKTNPKTIGSSSDQQARYHGLTPQPMNEQSPEESNNSATNPSPIEPLSQPEAALSEPSLYALLDAEFAIDRGDIKRGLEIYKQQAFKEDATAVFERALTLSLRYDSAETSLAFARNWQWLHPDHVPAWFYVAHLALKAHDYTLAGETLNRILRYDPRADLSEILIGIYPAKEQDQRELLDTLQPLDSTHNASLSVLKAGLLLKFNEPKAALLHVDQALRLQPNNVPVITLKTDILRKLVSPEDVLAYINQARQQLPNRKSLYLYEIRYLLEYQQSRQAWELLLEANDRFKEDTEITLLAALVSLDIEEYAQADRLLKTLAENPGYIDQANYYLGISAERQQRFAEAKNYFNSVMQENLVLAARKKVVAFELINNNTEAAIATLRQLRQQFEVFAPDTYILQADILRQQDAITEAQALLETASRRYPDNEALLFARAELLDDQEDFIVKRTLLKHLLAIAPDDLDYQLDYAEMLLANDPNSAEGLTLANKIMRIHFDEDDYNNDRHLEALNILAASALANKQYDQVIEYLQIPYDVSPTLRSGVLLLRAYQGLEDSVAVNSLLADLQRRFSFGQQNINDRIQQY